jgi:hypothetical protein
MFLQNVPGKFTAMGVPGLSVLTAIATAIALAVALTAPVGHAYELSQKDKDIVEGLKISDLKRLLKERCSLRRSMPPPAQKKTSLSMRHATEASRISSGSCSA